MVPRRRLLLWLLSSHHSSRQARTHPGSPRCRAPPSLPVLERPPSTCPPHTRSRRPRPGIPALDGQARSAHAPPSWGNGAGRPGTGQGGGRTPPGRGRRPQARREPRLHQTAPPNRPLPDSQPPARRAGRFLTLCNRLLLCAAILEGPRGRARLPPPAGAGERSG